MVHVELKNTQFRNYFESENGFVTGTAFTKNGEMLSGKTLMNYVASFDSPEDLARILPDLNGFYAFAVRKRDSLIAGVDRIRSIPLFYGQRGDDFFLSDSADWVREKVGDNQMDSLAKEEFLLCGYVTGSDTLFPGVKQIQAGEAIIVGKDDKGNFYVGPQRYFRYLPTMDSHESEEEIFHQLDAVLDRVFKRLIDYADDRTIVVPLSGGYDSRLIVLMLKRFGYMNIVAFSYGKPGNKETMVSKEVAEKLEIKWEFVPYSNEQWYEWYRSPDMKDYFDMAGNLSSLPHIQDWPAVKALKEEKRIPENAVFVPGHTPVYCFQSSNRVETLWESKGSKGEECFFKTIKGAHYNLNRGNDKLHKERNSHYLKNYCFITKEETAAVADSWAWTERQSKFIGNSVRAYEFFGYDWWMPFWDIEFVSFYERMPYKLRLEKSLYAGYVRKEYSNQAGIPLEESPGNSGTRSQFMNRAIYLGKQLLPESLLFPVKKIRLVLNFRKDAMQFYGINTKEVVHKRIMAGFATSDSIIADDLISVLNNQICDSKKLHK